MADTNTQKCLSDGQLAGAIIGSIIGTLAICVGVALALFYFFWRNRANATKPSKVGGVDVESNGRIERIERSSPGTPKKTMRDQVTMIESFKVERKSFGTQKSFSVENINDAETHVHLKAEDLNGIGFNIKGNMTDGIYVKSVVPKGPADLCGNILVDDRIRSLTISFDGMVYEDAVTLLSYASPYQVKFVLERKLGDGMQTLNSESTTSPRVHPLFRSNTLTHCHFSPCSPSPPPYQMTPEKIPMSPEPIGDRQDVISPEPVKEVEQNMVVEEDKKMVSSDYSSDHSIKEDEKASETSESTGLGSVQSIEEKTEVVSPIPPQRTVTSPPPSPSPPKVVAEKLPPKKTTGIPIKRTPTQKRDGTTSSPPQISEARVSRIPKRGDSMKTPIVERKLPPLPKSALQKKEPQPDNADIWSRLYQEKKGALKKTRDVKSPEPLVHSPPSNNNNNTEMNSSTASSGSNGGQQSYGTLNRERRERLAENDEILQRQRDELKQLGIL